MRRCDTVDGSLKSGGFTHQLRLVVYPIFYRVLYILGGWEWDFFHQQYLIQNPAAALVFLRDYNLPNKIMANVLLIPLGYRFSGY